MTFDLYAIYIVYRNIVARNYNTVTDLDYRPYEDPTGTEPLPNTCHQVGSGFVREKPLTVPTEGEVRNVAINTRSASAPVNIMPKYKPRLHKIQSKDPVEAENGGYVSCFCIKRLHFCFTKMSPSAALNFNMGCSNLLIYYYI